MRLMKQAYYVLTAKLKVTYALNKIPLDARPAQHELWLIFILKLRVKI